MRSLAPATREWDNAVELLISGPKQYTRNLRHNKKAMRNLFFCVLTALLATGSGGAQTVTGRYGLFEAAFEASGGYANPYREASAEAIVRRPDGRSWNIPLFWDGGKIWKLRVSPDTLGKWTFTVKSADGGLNGRNGAFTCAESRSAGGLTTLAGRTSHFARQNGQPFWFMADTAWGYFTDSPEDKHHRAQAEHYARRRAAQGFNAIHSMLMSEQGVGNNRGLPFVSMAEETLNPGYWREVDERLEIANRQGLTVGLALAWGDKRKVEPFAWRMFPDVEARKRYARYIAARYSAYDVYFIVSGEWHGEVRTRTGVSEEQVFREFVEIGNALDAAEPHGRMITIHPMSRHGSVREFAAAPWMSFGDYQQNYRNLHATILLSRHLPGPVVNSEYGYYLRDQDGDGKPDKDNSHSAEDMRFASWDIVTAGGYLVSGFGTTYFAGHRDPGPFDVDAAKNKDWEQQIGFIKKFFEGLEYWRLIPADPLLRCAVPRGEDRGGRTPKSNVHPPQTTYWAMADPGRTYVLYVRGTTAPVELDLGARPRTFRVRQYNPRTGEYRALGEQAVAQAFKYQAPDEQDWVVLLEGK